MKLDKILIIENESIVVNHLQAKLKNIPDHVDIEVCTLISDARQKLEETTYDVIVSELQLPDGSFVDDLLPFIDTQASKVVIITGRGSESIVAKLFKSGIREYFIKDLVGNYIENVGVSIKKALKKNMTDPSIDRILFIEDDPLDIEIIQQKFISRNKERYACEIASSISDAKEKLEILHFDIIVSDVYLSDGDIFKVLEMAELVDCPVVAITGGGSEETAIRILQAGAVDYMCKDDNGGEYLLALDRIIRNVVNEHKTRVRIGMLTEALKARNQELERSNHELEQFAYVVTHDLQEPLRTISSFTQLLADRYKDRLDEEANEFIYYVVDGAKRMRGLIHDMLKYSRLTNLADEFKPVNVSELCDLTIRDLTGAINESGAVITRDELPEVSGDPYQLQQLFLNLFSNAIKYRSNERECHVHVSASESENYWTVCVSDNGIGIAPDYYDKVFIIFQRLHNKNEYSGTGIGLAICKKIVENHGGRIWVKSNSSQGSNFYFTLIKEESSGTVLDNRKSAESNDTVWAGQGLL